MICLVSEILIFIATIKYTIECLYLYIQLNLKLLSPFIKSKKINKCFHGNTHNQKGL